jgi:hypothetical protein
MDPKNKQPEKPKSSSNQKVLIGCLIAVVAFLILVIMVIAGWWGYKYTKNKAVQKMQTEINQSQKQGQNQFGQSVATQSSESVYVNNTFGFRLAMTPAWKYYKTKEEPIGGDFEVSRISFSLPTAQKNWMAPDMPGYFNAFTVSAYVKDSWDETVRANGGSMPMGEEIGRNNYNVFAWSHFNGDPPSDVSEQAIFDMQAIVGSIEVWNVDETAAGVVAPDVPFTSGLDWETGTRPEREADFDYDSVYYWNCKHSYTLNYPTAWSNNGMTLNSDKVILKGNQVQVQVDAVSISKSKTLQEFAEERAGNIEGVQAWNEIVDWGNGTTVLRATFTDPDSTALWWMSGSGYGMELKASGSEYNNNYSNINGLLATLDPNSQYLGDKCGTTTSVKSPVTPKVVTPKNCSFPNGDFEDWWNVVSQDVRDCYISKYGYPPF